MNARIRNLLTIALTTALVSPLAMAQKGEARGAIQGHVTSQAARDLPRPNLPTQAADRAVDRAADSLDRPAADAMQSRKAAGAVDKATERSMSKAQGATHAAAHSSIVQRDTWVKLDANGDGRISATEADLDAGFEERFAVLDSNNDGFISDTEFRVKASTSQGAAHAAPHSAVVQRSVWTRLDVDRDGRISMTEADIDADFDASFDTLDSNNDDFVSDAEFRADAKAMHQERTDD